MPCTLLPAGDRAWLVEPTDPASIAGFVQHLRAQPLSVVEDVLPAATTVLVTLTSGTDLQTAGRALVEHFEAGSRLEVSAPPDDEDPLVIEVRYDGDDLAEVARLMGMSREQVIDAHTAIAWRCAFIGFAPGFGYLSATDHPLTVPRRPQSRTAVPAGAVGLADGYSAVYPRQSPGGWQIIGTTSAPMWDLTRDPPALLRPGRRVRFRESAR